MSLDPISALGCMTNTEIDELETLPMTEPFEILRTIREHAYELETGQGGEVAAITVELRTQSAPDRVLVLRSDSREGASPR